jgi:C-terminal processing protease CtpA/Prc
LTVDIFDVVYSDSAVYLEMMLDQIMAISPDLVNIILDLSWNTGGNIGSLYRITGFITDQPFVVSGIDRATGGVSSTYVIVDGVPLYSNLNWALLITPVTFSAANEMVTIFKENNLGVIIGVQSGGGACSITPILLPNGTAFTMSSVNMNAYRTGTGTEEDPYVYHNNEFGIEPDYTISISDIYSPSTLLPILQSEGQPS